MRGNLTALCQPVCCDCEMPVFVPRARVMSVATSVVMLHWIMLPHLQKTSF